MGFVTRSFLWFLSALALSRPAGAAPYLEFGLGLATFKKADSFFGTSVSDAGGFAGNFSIYFPTFHAGDIADVAFGLQNRMSCATGSAGQSLTFGSLNPSIRFEFWRFFAGAGYSPVAFLNTDKKGILGLHPYRGASSYFVEGGAIWRVVPEFQIIASGALEVGNGSFDASPSPIMEYSIRFRFPLDPRESSGSKGSRFDGYRYPFGIMK